MCKHSTFKQIFKCYPVSYSKLLMNFPNCNRTTTSSHIHVSVPYLQELSDPNVKNSHYFEKQKLTSKYYFILPSFHTKRVLNVHRSVEVRYYCTKKQPQVPKLMDFPQVVWPSVFKTTRNWILSNFIINRYFDSDFSLPEFAEASKQAVESVSGIISRGEIDSLSGLVTPEVIQQVRESMEQFTLKQRQQFYMRKEDIYFCFPYEVGVMFPNEDKNEGENQTRFVEITMCYHTLHGLKELREAEVSLPVDVGMRPEFQDKLFICNYRFIREFTKGVQDDWTINAINHFKPAQALQL